MELRNRAASALAGLVIAFGAATGGAYEVREGVKYLNDEDIQIAAGDVLTAADWEKIAPLIPDGYEQFIRWDGMRIEVQPSGDYAPYEAYQTATRENAGKASLDADGNLVGYVSGYPFPPEEVAVDEPEAGRKMAGKVNWNPRGVGLELDPIDWRIIKRGTMVRRLWSYYWRLYFCNKPEYAEMPNGCLTSDTNIEWKEFNHFTEPFDVKDTMLILHRYLDATKDDAWIYLPALRRVRRFGATQKSDALLGTEAALDDFWGFTNKVPERTWRYLGKTKVLAGMNVDLDVSDFGGPEGWYPLHKHYEVRDAYVLEAVPLEETHPYSRSVLYLDTQQLNNLYTQHYDRDGQLWKGWQVFWKWSETSPIEENHGKHVPLWMGPNVINVQSMTTLSAPCHNATAKGATPREARTAFSLTRLKVDSR
ncbi:MAG: DUF1329 domain-containing protein [Proteobacteria bacterium]|nr:DUF1329 domain-containing protein [Pseudomonadota bacterium]